MNEVLMRDDHFLHGPVAQFPRLFEQAGQTIANVDLPASCLIAIIERDGDIVVATPETQLLASDEIAIIGEPADLQDLRKSPLKTKDG
jgi:Trk K+ transport system NAD-binding subunit